MSISIVKHISGGLQVEEVLQQVRDWFFDNPNLPGTIEVNFTPDDKDKWKEVKLMRPSKRLIRMD